MHTHKINFLSAVDEKMGEKQLLCSAQFAGQGKVSFFKHYQSLKGLFKVPKEIQKLVEL